MKLYNNNKINKMIMDYARSLGILRKVGYPRNIEKD